MGGPRSDFSERGSPEFWGQAEPRRAAPVNPAAGLARAIGDRYKRNTFMAMRDNFIEQAALRFEKYAPDSEEAGQSAQLLRDNPKVFHMMASQFGGGGAGYGKFEERFRGQAIQGSRRRILDTLASGGYDEEGEGLDAQATYQRALADLHEEDRGGNDWLRKTMQPRRESRVADLEARGQQLLLEQEGGYSGDADQALAQLTQYFSENGHPDPAKAARTIVNNLEAAQTRQLKQASDVRAAEGTNDITPAQLANNNTKQAATDWILDAMKKWNFNQEGMRRALERGSPDAIAQFLAMEAGDDATPKEAGTLWSMYNLAKTSMVGESPSDYRKRLRSMIGLQGLPLPAGVTMGDPDADGNRPLNITEEQEAQLQKEAEYLMPDGSTWIYAGGGNWRET